ncbi:MAG TPA: ABC transporter permease [Leptolyngbyaceae cyanobacterium]
MALSPIDLTLTTLRDLSGNWVRSSLTTLGIFMGVAAVNATLNIDAITTAQIQQKLAERDKPFVVPNLWNPDTYESPKLTDEEIQTLMKTVPGISSVSTTKWVPLDNVQYGGQSAGEVSASSVSANYQQTTGRQIDQGRFFEQADFDDYRPVAIIDAILAAQLFPDGNSPLGEGIFANGTRLTVIGVMATKKTWASEEPKGELWIPDTYGSLLAGDFQAGGVQFALKQLEDYATVQAAVDTFLKQNYPTYNVYVWSNAEDIYKEDQQQRTSARILKVVGLLALVIGGVGIANITVATVMERTREIGLRRAIGATDLEVMAQFIVEAALLSLVGGALAVVSVHFLTKTATSTLFEAPYEFQPRDAAISMASAFAVGVGASLLPALRVTRIDIIQALRGE